MLYDTTFFLIQETSTHADYYNNATEFGTSSNASSMTTTEDLLTTSNYIQCMYFKQTNKFFSPTISEKFGRREDILCLSVPGY